MEQEAGLEAAGLRGGLFPSRGGLLLARDATASRDAVAVLLHAAAAALRSPTPPRALLLVAAHHPPRAYVAALRRLGAPHAALRRALLVVDARGGGGAKEEAGEDDEEAREDGVAVVRAGGVCALERLVAARLGADGAGAVVLVDSQGALRLGLRCDAEALVRAALGVGAGVAIGVDLDLGPAGGRVAPDPDGAHALLEELADAVADVVPLADATEYAGRVTLEKVHGMWRRPAPPGGPPAAAFSFLYSVHDTAVRYYR